MRLSIHALLLIAFGFTSHAAFANELNADDVKWVNQCIRDNKGEGAKPAVVRMYCFCMNEKMDSSENQSITQWEKKNPQARRECDRVSGWR